MSPDIIIVKEYYAGIILIGVFDAIIEVKRRPNLFIKCRFKTCKSGPYWAEGSRAIMMFWRAAALTKLRHLLSYWNRLIDSIFAVSKDISVFQNPPFISLEIVTTLSQMNFFSKSSSPL